MAIEQSEALLRLGAFIGGGIAIGVAAAGAAIADGVAGAQLLAGVTRQPEAQGRLMGLFMLVVGLAEGTFFISLVFGFMLLFLTPGL